MNGSYHRCRVHASLQEELHERMDHAQRMRGVLRGLCWRVTDLDVPDVSIHLQDSDISDYLTLFPVQKHEKSQLHSTRSRIDVYILLLPYFPRRTCLMNTYMCKSGMQNSSLDGTTESCHITINHCFSKSCTKKLCSGYRIERWSDTSMGF